SSIEIHAAKRGRTYVRSLIARTVASGNPAEFASRRWGIGPATTISKAAVAALDSSGFADEAAREFLAAAAERSLLGRIPGLRRVPANIRLGAFSSRPG